MAKKSATKKSAPAKSTPAKTAAKKAPAEKKAPSNKETVYKKWQKDGEPATDEKIVAAYLKLTKNAVKESTIRAWLSGWRNGRNLPACAKK